MNMRTYDDVRRKSNHNQNSRDMLRNDALNGLLQRTAKELRAKHREIRYLKITTIILALSTASLVSAILNLLQQECP